MPWVLQDLNPCSGSRARGLSPLGVRTWVCCGTRVPQRGGTTQRCHVPRVSPPYWGPLGWTGRGEEEEGLWNPLTPVLPSWVQEFLNEENKGLDVLLEYLAFAQCSVAYVPAAAGIPGAPFPLRPCPGSPVSGLGSASPQAQRGWGSWGVQSCRAPCLGENSAPFVPSPGDPRGPHVPAGIGGAACSALPDPTRYDMESTENGSPGSDKGKPLERSVEDLSKSNSSSPTQGVSKVRHLTVR